MTVRELISELQNFDGDIEVLTKTVSSGGYVDSIGKLITRTITSSWCNEDYKAVVICADDQVGMVN